MGPLSAWLPRLRAHNVNSVSTQGDVSQTSAVTNFWSPLLLLPLSICKEKSGFMSKALQGDNDTDTTRQKATGPSPALGK